MMHGPSIPPHEQAMQCKQFSPDAGELGKACEGSGEPLIADVQTLPAEGDVRVTSSCDDQSLRETSAKCTEAKRHLLRDLACRRAASRESHIRSQFLPAEPWKFCRRHRKKKERRETLEQPRVILERLEDMVKKSGAVVPCSDGSYQIRRDDPPQLIPFDDYPLSDNHLGLDKQTERYPYFGNYFYFPDRMQVDATLPESLYGHEYLKSRIPNVLEGKEIRGEVNEDQLVGRSSLYVDVCESEDDPEDGVQENYLYPNQSIKQEQEVSDHSEEGQSVHVNLEDLMDICEEELIETVCQCGKDTGQEPNVCEQFRIIRNYKEKSMAYMCGTPLSSCNLSEVQSARGTCAAGRKARSLDGSPYVQGYKVTRRLSEPSITTPAFYSQQSEEEEEAARKSTHNAGQRRKRRKSESQLFVPTIEDPPKLECNPKKLSCLRRIAVKEKAVCPDNRRKSEPTIPSTASAKLKKVSKRRGSADTVRSRKSDSAAPPAQKSEHYQSKFMLRNENKMWKIVEKMPGNEEEVKVSETFLENQDNSKSLPGVQSCVAEQLVEENARQDRALDEPSLTVQSVNEDSVTLDSHISDKHLVSTIPTRSEVEVKCDLHQNNEVIFPELVKTEIPVDCTNVQNYDGNDNSAHVVSEDDNLSKQCDSSSTNVIKEVCENVLHVGLENENNFILEVTDSQSAFRTSTESVIISVDTGENSSEKTTVVDKVETQVGVSVIEDAPAVSLVVQFETAVEKSRAANYELDASGKNGKAEGTKTQKDNSSHLLESDEKMVGSEGDVGVIVLVQSGNEERESVGAHESPSPRISMPSEEAHIEETGLDRGVDHEETIDEDVSKNISTVEETKQRAPPARRGRRKKLHWKQRLALQAIEALKPPPTPDENIISNEEKQQPTVPVVDNLGDEGTNELVLATKTGEENAPVISAVGNRRKRRGPQLKATLQVPDENEIEVSPNYTEDQLEVPTYGNNVQGYTFGENILDQENVHYESTENRPPRRMYTKKSNSSVRGKMIYRKLKNESFRQSILRKFHLVTKSRRVIRNENIKPRRVKSARHLSTENFAAFSHKTVLPLEVKLDKEKMIERLERRNESQSSEIEVVNEGRRNNVVECNRSEVKEDEKDNSDRNLSDDEVYTHENSKSDSTQIKLHVKDSKFHTDNEPQNIGEKSPVRENCTNQTQIPSKLSESTRHDNQVGIKSENHEKGLTITHNEETFDNRKKSKNEWKMNDTKHNEVEEHELRRDHKRDSENRKRDSEDSPVMPEANQKHERNKPLDKHLKSIEKDEVKKCKTSYEDKSASENCSSETKVFGEEKYERKKKGASKQGSDETHKKSRDDKLAVGDREVTRESRKQKSHDEKCEKNYSDEYHPKDVNRKHRYSLDDKLVADKHGNDTRDSYTPKEIGKNKERYKKSADEHHARHTNTKEIKKKYLEDKSGREKHIRNSEVSQAPRDIDKKFYKKKTREHNPKETDKQVPETEKKSLQDKPKEEKHRKRKTDCQLSRRDSEKQEKRKSSDEHNMKDINKQDGKKDHMEYPKNKSSTENYSRDNTRQTEEKYERINKYSKEHDTKSTDILDVNRTHIKFHENSGDERQKKSKDEHHAKSTNKKEIRKLLEDTAGEERGKKDMKIYHLKNEHDEKPERRWSSEDSNLKETDKEEVKNKDKKYIHYKPLGENDTKDSYASRGNSEKSNKRKKNSEELHLKFTDKQEVRNKRKKSSDDKLEDYRNGTDHEKHEGVTKSSKEHHPKNLDKNKRKKHKKHTTDKSVAETKYNYSSREVNEKCEKVKKCWEEHHLQEMDKKEVNENHNTLDVDKQVVENLGDDSKERDESKEQSESNAPVTGVDSYQQYYKRTIDENESDSFRDAGSRFFEAEGIQNEKLKKDRELMRVEEELRAIVEGSTREEKVAKVQESVDMNGRKGGTILEKSKSQTQEGEASHEVMDCSTSEKSVEVANDSTKTYKVEHASVGECRDLSSRTGDGDSTIKGEDSQAHQGPEPGDAKAQEELQASETSNGCFTNQNSDDDNYDGETNEFDTPDTRDSDELQIDLEACLEDEDTVPFEPRFRHQSQSPQDSNTPLSRRIRRKRLEVDKPRRKWRRSINEEDENDASNDGVEKRRRRKSGADTDSKDRMKSQDAEKGKRLAQDIPGFNWLEEKIRHGTPRRKDGDTDGSCGESALRQIIASKSCEVITLDSRESTERRKESPPTDSREPVIVVAPSILSAPPRQSDRSVTRSEEVFGPGLLPAFPGNVPLSAFRNQDVNKAPRSGAESFQNGQSKSSAEKIGQSVFFRQDRCREAAKSAAAEIAQEILEKLSSKTPRRGNCRIEESSLEVTKMRLDESVDNPPTIIAKSDLQILPVQICKLQSKAPPSGQKPSQLEVIELKDDDEARKETSRDPIAAHPVLKSLDVELTTTTVSNPVPKTSVGEPTYPEKISAMAQNASRAFDDGFHQGDGRMIGHPGDAQPLLLPAVSEQQHFSPRCHVQRAPPQRQVVIPIRPPAGNYYPPPFPMLPLDTSVYPVNSSAGGQHRTPTSYHPLAPKPQPPYAQIPVRPQPIQPAKAATSYSIAPTQYRHGSGGTVMHQKLSYPGTSTGSGMVPNVVCQPTLTRAPGVSSTQFKESVNQQSNRMAQEPRSFPYSQTLLEGNQAWPGGLGRMPPQAANSSAKQLEELEKLKSDAEQQLHLLLKEKEEAQKALLEVQKEREEERRRLEEERRAYREEATRQRHNQNGVQVVELQSNVPVSSQELRLFPDKRPNDNLHFPESPVYKKPKLTVPQAFRFRDLGSNLKPASPPTGSTPTQPSPKLPVGHTEISRNASPRSATITSSHSHESPMDLSTASDHEHSSPGVSHARRPSIEKRPSPKQNPGDHCEKCKVILGPEYVDGRPCVAHHSAGPHRTEASMVAEPATSSQKASADPPPSSQIPVRPTPRHAEAPPSTVEYIQSQVNPSSVAHYYPYHKQPYAPYPTKAQAAMAAYRTNDMYLNQLRHQIHHQQQQHHQKYTNQPLAGMRPHHPFPETSALQYITPETTVHVPSQQSHQRSLDPSRYLCGNCSREARFMCSGCKRAWYCSQECQGRQWNSHSQLCRRMHLSGTS